MKLSINKNNIFRMIIVFSILVTSVSIRAQDATEVIILKTNNWQTLKTIQDSLAVALYNEFGHSFELDSTLKNGCINFINEKFLQKTITVN